MSPDTTLATVRCEDERGRSGFFFSKKASSMTPENISWMWIVNVFLRRSTELLSWMISMRELSCSDFDKIG